MPQPPDNESTSAVVYIGNYRWLSACQHARDISYHAKTNIKPSSFVQYVLDNFSDQARAALLMELRNESSKEG
ncbi:hypothetical protein [Pantoea agglomerans]|uniref:hypothetical protein n=1 Tax=Enterobacter agglomerans TaxID=549 RepID=UPI000DAE0866|nr:hypothetical protein [Pantoea agglomerans]RAH26335.1 hypothetical protein DOT37_23840 [Pantoea agglomerans]TGX88189.1 hypothetical protein E5821_23805 [Pantoea agglomerans]